MNSPNFQFTTGTILLATAFIGICLGGVLAALSIMEIPPIAPRILFMCLAGAAPYFMPVVLAAYAIGRRTLTVRIVLAFALLEAAALGVVFWIENPELF